MPFFRLVQRLEIDRYSLCENDVAMQTFIVKADAVISNLLAMQMCVQDIHQRQEATQISPALLRCKWALTVIGGKTANFPSVH